MIVMEDKQLKSKFRQIVRTALKEDIGRGDITTDAVVREEDRTLGIIFSKQNGVLCGLDLARTVFAELDERIAFEAQMKDGDEFTTGAAIATLIGPAAPCLKGERTALNFLQHLSGIATLTRKFVQAVGGRIRVLDTRKTAPGLRFVEKYAVRTGGGCNHRFGLYDMALIKDNHIQIAGGITNAVRAVRKARRIFIEVEVRTMDEVKEALGLKVDRIMLDNMNLERLRQAVEFIRREDRSKRRVEIEVSGGVDLGTVRHFAELDIDFVSVGCLTHSAPAVDIALKMKPLSPAEK
jgi:nicotinate-nucleotide pyrophosphorylase (carboxylating)